MDDSGRHDATASASPRAGAHPAAASNLRFGLVCLVVVLLVMVIVNAVQSGAWVRLLVQLVGLGCLVVAGLVGTRAGAGSPYADGRGVTRESATDAQVLRRRLALLGLVLVLVATGLFLLQVG
ncbi:hypothetical protein [Nocardioides sp.]|uniref:hypothetical protein n=1 Tax=Nocardioides sp. TaxID=35761 RepID=UPI00286A6936|nr:hypothetical protein [Nocardioides sp.]